jgi:hypothetical protein
MASAWSEPALIRIASGFEAAADVRRRPRFLRSFDPDAAANMRANAIAAAARDSRAAVQKYGARLDPLMVPRLRRLTHL